MRSNDNGHRVVPDYFVRCPDCHGEGGRWQTDGGDRREWAPCSTCAETGDLTQGPPRVVRPPRTAPVSVEPIETFGRPRRG